MHVYQYIAPFHSELVHTISSHSVNLSRSFLHIHTHTHTLSLLLASVADLGSHCPTFPANGSPPLPTQCETCNLCDAINVGKKPGFMVFVMKAGFVAPETGGILDGCVISLSFICICYRMASYDRIYGYFYEGRVRCPRDWRYTGRLCHITLIDLYML